jgi:hypothetical protein
MATPAGGTIEATLQQVVEKSTEEVLPDLGPLNLQELKPSLSRLRSTARDFLAFVPEEELPEEPRNTTLNIAREVLAAVMRLINFNPVNMPHAHEIRAAIIRDFRSAEEQLYKAVIPLVAYYRGRTESRPPDIEHANLSAFWSQRGPATS